MSSKCPEHLPISLALLLTACSAATSNDAQPPLDSTNTRDLGAMPDATHATQAESPLERERGWLGIVLDQVDVDEARALGFDHPLIRVDQVFPDSPASSAELMEGDLVLAFEGTPLVDTGELVEHVEDTAPGTTVTITLVRQGAVLEQPVMLGLRPGLEDLIDSLLVGRQAPPLVANRLVDGERLTLDIELGHIVVLDFWATWCGPCRRVLPDLNDLQLRYAERGVSVIGVSNEDAETIRAYLAEHPLDYTIAYDIDEATTRAYFVTAYPTLLLIDRDGVIRQVFIGGTEIPNLESQLLKMLDESGE